MDDGQHLRFREHLSTHYHVNVLAFTTITWIFHHSRSHKFLGIHDHVESFNVCSCGHKKILNIYNQVDFVRHKQNQC